LGQPIGTSHTRIYNVLFQDGHTEEYAANIIVENKYSQLDSSGTRYLLLKEISNHRSDETAVPIHEKYITHGNNPAL
jgi:prepilin-type processing-associated H-X9-DG protein